MSASARFRIALNHENPDVVSRGLREFSDAILRENCIDSCFGVIPVIEELDMKSLLNPPFPNEITGTIKEYIEASPNVEELFVLWNIPSRDDDKHLCAAHMRCLCSIVRCLRSNSKIIDNIANRITSSKASSILDQLSSGHKELIIETLMLLFEISRVSEQSCRDLFQRLKGLSGINSLVSAPKKGQHLDVVSVYRQWLILINLSFLESASSEILDEIFSSSSMFKKFLRHTSKMDPLCSVMLLNGIAYVQRDSFFLNHSPSLRNNLVDINTLKELVCINSDIDRNIYSSVTIFLKEFSDSLAALLASTNKNPNQNFRHSAINFIGCLQGHLRLDHREMQMKLLKQQPSLLAKAISSVSISSWNVPSSPEITLEYITSLHHLGYLLNNCDYDNLQIQWISNIVLSGDDERIKQCCGDVWSNCCPKELGKKEWTKIINHSNHLLAYHGLSYISAALNRFQKLFFPKDMATALRNRVEIVIHDVIHSYLPDLHQFVSLRTKLVNSILARSSNNDSDTNEMVSDCSETYLLTNIIEIFSKYIRLFSSPSLHSNFDFIKILDHQISKSSQSGSPIRVLNAAVLRRSLVFLEQLTNSGHGNWFGSKSDAIKVVQNTIVQMDWKGCVKMTGIHDLLQLLKFCNLKGSSAFTAKNDLPISEAFSLLRSILKASGLFEGHQCCEWAMNVELEGWISLATATFFDVEAYEYLLLVSYHWNLSLCCHMANMSLERFLSHSKISNADSLFSSSPLFYAALMISLSCFEFLENDLPKHIRARYTNLFDHSNADSIAFFDKFFNGIQPQIRLIFLEILFFVNSESLFPDKFCHDLTHRLNILPLDRYSSITSSTMIFLTSMTKINSAFVSLPNIATFDQGVIISSRLISSTSSDLLESCCSSSDILQDVAEVGIARASLDLSSKKKLCSGDHLVTLQSQAVHCLPGLAQHSWVFFVQLQEVWTIQLCEEYLKRIRDEITTQSFSSHAWEKSQWMYYYDVVRVLHWCLEKCHEKTNVSSCENVLQLAYMIVMEILQRDMVPIEMFTYVNICPREGSIFHYPVLCRIALALAIRTLQRKGKNFVLSNVESKFWDQISSSMLKVDWPLHSWKNYMFFSAFFVQRMSSNKLLLQTFVDLALNTNGSALLDSLSSSKTSMINDVISFVPLDVTQTSVISSASWKSLNSAYLSARENSKSRCILLSPLGKYYVLNIGKVKRWSIHSYLNFQAICSCDALNNIEKQRGIFSSNDEIQFLYRNDNERLFLHLDLLRRINSPSMLVQFLVDHQNDLDVRNQLVHKVKELPQDLDMLTRMLKRQPDCLISSLIVGLLSHSWVPVHNPLIAQLSRVAICMSSIESQQQKWLCQMGASFLLTLWRTFEDENGCYPHFSSKNAMHYESLSICWINLAKAILDQCVSTISSILSSKVNSVQGNEKSVKESLEWWNILSNILKINITGASNTMQYSVIKVLKKLSIDSIFSKALDKMYKHLLKYQLHNINVVSKLCDIVSFCTSNQENSSSLWLATQYWKIDAKSSYHPSMFWSLLLTHSKFEDHVLSGTEEYKCEIFRILLQVLELQFGGNEDIDVLSEQTSGFSFESDSDSNIYDICCRLYQGTLRLLDRIILRLWVSLYVRHRFPSLDNLEIKTAGAFWGIQLPWVYSTIGNFPIHRRIMPLPFLFESKDFIDKYQSWNTLFCNSIMDQWNNHSPTTEGSNDAEVLDVESDESVFDENDQNSNVDGSEDVENVNEALDDPSEDENDESMHSDSSIVSDEHDEKIVLDEGYSSEEDGKRYDPSFWISYLHGKLFRQDVSIRNFANSGGLALILCSLSNSCSCIRLYALSALRRVDTLLQSQDAERDPSFRERPQVQLLVDFVRNMISYNDSSLLIRLPPIVALALARASLHLLQPNHELFTRMNKYLLSRPFCDPKDVPLFESTVFGAEAAIEDTDRLSALRMISHHLLSHDDHINLCRKNAYSYIMGIFPNVISHVKIAHVVLDVLDKALGLSFSSNYLISKCSIITWITSMISLGLVSSRQEDKAATKDSMSPTLIIRLLSLLRKSFAAWNLHACQGNLMDFTYCIESSLESILSAIYGFSCQGKYDRGIFIEGIRSTTAMMWDISMYFRNLNLKRKAYGLGIREVIERLYHFCFIVVNHEKAQDHFLLCQSLCMAWLFYFESAFSNSSSTTSFPSLEKVYFLIQLLISGSVDVEQSGYYAIEVKAQPSPAESGNSYCGSKHVHQLSSMYYNSLLFTKLDSFPWKYPIHEQQYSTSSNMKENFSQAWYYHGVYSYGSGVLPFQSEVDHNEFVICSARTALILLGCHHKDVSIERDIALELCRWSLVQAHGMVGSKWPSNDSTHFMYGETILSVLYGISQSSLSSIDILSASVGHLALIGLSSLVLGENTVESLANRHDLTDWRLLLSRLFSSFSFMIKEISPIAITGNNDLSFEDERAINSFKYSITESLQALAFKTMISVDYGKQIHKLSGMYSVGIRSLHVLSGFMTLIDNGHLLTDDLSALEIKHWCNILSEQLNMNSNAFPDKPNRNLFQRQWNIMGNAHISSNLGNFVLKGNFEPSKEIESKNFSTETLARAGAYRSAMHQLWQQMKQSRSKAPILGQISLLDSNGVDDFEEDFDSTEIEQGEDDMKGSNKRSRTSFNESLLPLKKSKV